MVNKSNKSKMKISENVYSSLKIFSKASKNNSEMHVNDKTNRTFLITKPALRTFLITKPPLHTIKKLVRIVNSQVEN